ncbi:packaged DNA stabilization protein gp10 [Patescibacteria group bacterium]|nr:packaged DNA stabilization protein gp10 [Patescibacteria group bacterium]
MEDNPLLNDNQTSVISRPGLKYFTQVGTGNIRRVYTCEGTFSDDLFVVSGLFLYRVNSAGVATQVGQIGQTVTDAVAMAATAPLGSTPAFLYIADGGILWFYTDNGQARAELTATGLIPNNDVISIDGVYYKFTTGSVDSGTPAGTSASPWLVALSTSDNSVSLTNLYNAINLSGVAGTDYSSAITMHPTCTAFSSTLNTLDVQYNSFGTMGNAVAVTVSGTNLVWNGTTFRGGGQPELRQVQVPNDSGCISVAYINGFVIVVPQQTADTKGRFYWIQPGANIIQPLNYATAERSPDGLYQVGVFGDMFWLFGQKTVEPWITTGNSATPMQRYQGILYDRGCWPNTAIQVKDSIILVDEDGAVFSIGRGQQTRLSNPAIEERIRLAIQQQGFFNAV